MDYHVAAEHANESISYSEYRARQQETLEKCALPALSQRIAESYDDDTAVNWPLPAIKYTLTR